MSSVAKHLVLPSGSLRFYRLRLHSELLTRHRSTGVRSLTWMLAFSLSVAVAARACVANDEDAESLVRSATKAAAANESRLAVEKATAAIEIDDQLAHAYYVRGRERFRLGDVELSVHDFDRYVALRPQLASRQWERGIACYYAKLYEEGAKQFELYQTYHDSDVENSVWRYLCMVPDTGIDKARSVMLPIRNDSRVPMMEIYRMYRGELKPADVLAATKRDDPAAPVLAGRQFYAHLYLALFYEVAGESDKAREYIQLAAAPELKTNSNINRYMWDVARIHADRLRANQKEQETP